MQRTTIYGLAAPKGANIDAQKTQHLRLIAANYNVDKETLFNKAGLGEVEFIAIGDVKLRFNFETDDVDEMLLIDVDVIHPAGTPEHLKSGEPFAAIEKGVKERALYGCRNVYFKITDLFCGKIPFEQAPSISEFIQVCCENKALIFGYEESNVTQGPVKFYDANIDTQLKVNAVESYTAAQNTSYKAN